MHSLLARLAPALANTRAVREGGNDAAGVFCASFMDATRRPSPSGDDGELLRQASPGGPFGTALHLYLPLLRCASASHTNSAHRMGMTEASPLSSTSASALATASTLASP